MEKQESGFSKLISKFLNFFQDGSYLAEFLLSKGYTVHGIIRRSSSFNTARIHHLYADPHSHKQDRMILHYGDMTDTSCLVKIINEVRPREIYNLAAQSHVKVRPAKEKIFVCCPVALSKAFRVTYM